MLGEAERDTLLNGLALRSETTDHDAALIERVGRGDADAFRALVDGHAEVIYRLAWRMLVDAAEAEDVVQETFTRLWTSAPRWRDGEGRVGGWLHRVVTNLCLDRLRRRPNLDLEAVAEPADARPLAFETIDAGRVGDAVAEALAALPDRQRAAIILTYYEALPNAGAAELMEMKIKAFESLLLRARAGLRTLVEARGIGVGDLAEGEAA